MPERATRADADQLAELDRACFGPAERWSPQLWAEELEAADRLVLVQRDRDLMAAATFALVFETLDLHRVMVRPSHRGLGLARQLIAAGAQWAGDRGAERILLEVRHENTEALGLYAGLGFTTIDSRRDYYGAGLHAHVMQCDLRGMTPSTPTGASPGMTPSTPTGASPGMTPSTPTGAPRPTNEGDPRG